MADPDPQKQPQPGTKVETTGTQTTDPSKTNAEAALNQAPQSPLPEGLTDKDLEAAAAWAAKVKLGSEAISQLQEKLGVAVDGKYTRETIIAVYNKQREKQKKGALTGPGQASRTFFEQLGLVFTHTIEAAKVADPVLEQVKKLYPDGVTIAVYTQYKTRDSNAVEITRAATAFGKSKQAVGVVGGNVTLGEAMAITKVEQVVETVQSIHRGLLERHKQSLQQQVGQSETKGGQAGTTASEPPAWTKVKNLAMFSHGLTYGVSLDEDNSYSKGLHSEKRDQNPSNIESFVKGLASAVAKDVRVQLFACSTARSDGEESYSDWQGHKQGERKGEDGFADELAEELGPDASVYGHSTAGHTTENFAARVFGKDAGGGEGGLHLFDVLYDEAYIQAELKRLYPEVKEEERPDYHDPLREVMWSHYQDVINSEHQRSGSAKRFAVPIGQEMFINPENAKKLVREDWTKNWIPTRLKKIKPTPKPKPKKPAAQTPAT